MHALGPLRSSRYGCETRSQEGAREKEGQREKDSVPEKVYDPKGFSEKEDRRKKGRCEEDRHEKDRGSEEIHHAEGFEPKSGSEKVRDQEESFQEGYEPGIRIPGEGPREEENNPKEITPESLLGPDQGDPAVKSVIYLDHNATTPVDPQVLEAMMPYFSEHFGNAASTLHEVGRRAETAVEKAREQVARLVGAEAVEIVFTSGATEANNMVLKGVPDFYEHKGDHVISVTTEHKAVLDCCALLEEKSKTVTLIDVDANGLIEALDIEEEITADTVLVSVMTANNETGVIQPIAEIGEVCRKHGVLFHTDAVQAVGKIPFDVNAMRVDLVSMSAHKIYGPKGVGALYMRRSKPRTQLTPLIDGGGHERGMRSGTLNVPAIVGFGEAAALALERIESDAAHLGKLRKRLEKQLSTRLTGVTVNGHATRRTPGTTNLSFEGGIGQHLVESLEGVVVSNGSACTTANVEPSHVLSSMGLDYDAALGAVRFSLGRGTTRKEIDFAIEQVVDVVTRLRSASS